MDNLDKRTSTDYAQSTKDGITQEKTYTRRSIGYVEGYGEYTARYGGLVTEGGNQFREEVITNEDSSEGEKPSVLSRQVNKQVDVFRNIFGYGSTNRTSDSIEDPTFIIYDLQIDYSTSPLFNQVADFFDRYAPLVEELNERKKIYEEFVSMVSKIFPGDVNHTTGSKRHYINSIGGLNNLFKKIVDYPTDVLTFTISEDITMFAQYLSELYSNLVYSYDTQRYLIPDNLLRFNMRIFFRDTREMLTVQNTNDGQKAEQINANISKFSYVLHDCQFDFFSSRNFGESVQTAGFGAGATTTPATLSFTVNYKSYSKITTPALIDDAVVIDLREREGDKMGDYERFNNDYKSQFEWEDTISRDEEENATKQYNIKTSNIYSTQNKKKKKHPLQEFGQGLTNAFTQELSDIRNVLVNQVKNRVPVAIEKAQKATSNAIFKNANYPGFQPITLTKFNVYYDSPTQAINRVSFLLGNFINKSVRELQRRVKLEWNGNKLNVYYDKSDAGTIVPREENIYESNPHYNQKFPEGDREPDGTYNEKYPEGDLMADGTYNEKYPEGDREPDGSYNTKYPQGDVSPNGTYNQKFPFGDREPDGTYNEKYPEGDREPDGRYNEKYPEGDREPDGTYNEKYPEGDREPDGRYNEKYPEGDRETDGAYNEKYPEGDREPDGKYNEKHPSGRVEPEGAYNEKHPSGRVEGTGEFHSKEPSGNVYKEETKTIKKSTTEVTSKDNVYDGSHIEEGPHKHPDGKVEEDGEYNDKNPKGNIYKKDSKDKE